MIGNHFCANSMQTLISQYQREMTLLIEVYQQRMRVELSTLTQTLHDLCAALKQTEWQRKIIFKEAVRLVMGTSPPERNLHHTGPLVVFDVLMEKVTAEYGVVCNAQTRVAEVFELPPDTSIHILKACVDNLMLMSPENSQNLDYITQSLQDIEKCHTMYDALLNSNRWHWHTTVALIQACMDPPEQNHMSCDR